jgi:hypothetical protein
MVLQLLVVWVGASIPIAFVLGRWMTQPTPTAATVDATQTVVAV